MSKIFKPIVIIVFLFILFGLDFLRDFVFKNLDLQIQYLSHITVGGISTIENYTHSYMEHFLSDYTILQIINLKWGFTFIFTFLFFISGGTFLLIMYNKKAVYFLLILYLSLFFASTVIYVLKFIGFNPNTCYLISMELMHFLQSSLPTLFLFLSYKIYLKSKSNPT